MDNMHKLSEIWENLALGFLHLASAIAILAGSLNKHKAKKAPSKKKKRKKHSKKK